MSYLHYKKDGTLDMRYKSSREFIQSHNPYHPAPNSYDYPNSPSSTAADIDYLNHQSPRLYDSTNIILNKDGSVSRRSRAVKSGDVTFDYHGKIDPNCKAVRYGYLILNQYGNPDIQFHRDLEIPKNPGDYRTSVYRHPYEQQKFRKENQCSNDYDASHIVDLEIARAILKMNPNLYLTASELHSAMKPLNKLLEMRPRSVNRANKKNPENDHAMAQRIIRILQGENVRRTRNLDDKILRMIEALHSIPSNEMNYVIKYILDRLESIKPQLIQLY